MLRIPISLQENSPLPEPSLKQSILSSAYKAVRSFLALLLVTKQSVISLNATRQSSAASSHSLWVLY